MRGNYPAMALGDYALIVAPATTERFEYAVGFFGQTRESTIISRVFGLSR